MLRVVAGRKPEVNRPRCELMIDRVIHINIFINSINHFFLHRGCVREVIDDAEYLIIHVYTQTYSCIHADIRTPDFITTCSLTADIHVGFGIIAICLLELLKREVLIPRHFCRGTGYSRLVTNQLLCPLRAKGTIKKLMLSNYSCTRHSKTLSPLPQIPSLLPNQFLQTAS